jgi:RNA polymerase sigma-70 factor (ECF subfamily)
MSSAATIDPASPDFRSFYDAWITDVRRWIRAMGASNADHDDIAQEVFLVVRRRLDTFDGAKPAAWLHQIVRYKVGDFRRRAWVRHIFTREHSDVPEILPDQGHGPAAMLERKQGWRALDVVLSQMNDHRRAAFLMSEIDGLTGEEIARRQKAPLNTVWHRVYKARREFSTLAEKYRRING